MPLNQSKWQLEDPNTLATPPEGFVNMRVNTDKTLWGRFPDGTLHEFTSTGALNIVGNLDPAGGNIDYPAASAGDIYIFISAGTIGTPPVDVEAGEMLLCVNNTAGGAGAGNDFVIYQINISYATEVIAGIIRIVTQTQIENGVDDEAAITTLKLYYLIQQFGLEWILTDEVRGRNTDGTTPLRINTNLHNVAGGAQNNIIIQPTQSVATTGATPSASSGSIEIRTLPSGNTEDATPAFSGYITLETANGGNATGTGNGGDGGPAGMSTGQGGTGVNGGNGGDLGFSVGRGGNTTAVNGDGGNSGLITIQALNGGNGAGTGTGGNSGSILIQVSDAGNGTGAGGSGGAGGNIQIVAGDNGLGDIGSGAVGNLTLAAGDARDIANGANGSQVKGGNVEITSGEGNTSDTGFPGDGGDINIQAGQGNIQVVDGGAGSKGSDGGNVLIKSGDAGDGVEESGRAGNITIETGDNGQVITGGDSADGANINLITKNGGLSPNGDGGDGGSVNITAGAGGAGGGATGNDGARGTIKLDGHFAISNVEDAITAGAGGTFPNARLLTSTYSRITTAAAPGDSVKLPISKGEIGETFYIRNDGANAIDIFANNGTDTINGVTSVSLVAGNSVKIVKLAATAYYVFD